MTHDPIRFKRGCRIVPRPHGSTEEIRALETNEGGTTAGHPCVDFVSVARDRAGGDPPFAPGGLAFVRFAGDVVTWSTQQVTNAPASLTRAQLAGVYECRVTNWRHVGGRNAPIKALLPQAGPAPARSS